MYLEHTKLKWIPPKLKTCLYGTLSNYLCQAPSSIGFNREVFYSLWQEMEAPQLAVAWDRTRNLWKQFCSCFVGSDHHVHGLEAWKIDSFKNQLGQLKMDISNINCMFLNLKYFFPVWILIIRNKLKNNSVSKLFWPFSVQINCTQNNCKF